MVTVSRLERYVDNAGNEIVYDGPLLEKVRIKFTGANNRLVVDGAARINNLVVDFDCDNGYCSIGPSKGVPAFSGAIRVGQDSRVEIGANVSATATVGMSATEGSAITIGDDVMFASQNQVRADDGHPIFDVISGKRVNVSRSIHIGNHVWLGWGAIVLGGSRVGDGSVLGFNTVLKGKVPNNAVAVGSPARVVRRNIAWERPHLSLSKPYYKPDASAVKKSNAYWQLTEEPGARNRLGMLPRKVLKFAHRVRRRLQRGR